ncbi:hypothetical protein KUCAC02_011867, partial [Chaenocephalus aceratus]
AVGRGNLCAGVMPPKSTPAGKYMTRHTRLHPGLKCHMDSIQPTPVAIRNGWIGEKR